MNNQMDLFVLEKDPRQKAEELKKEIHRTRCGIFKRYEEEKKRLDFLDSEIEDFVKEYLNTKNI